MNYNEDSQQLSVVLLPLQAAPFQATEAAHRGLVVHLTSLLSKTLLSLVYSVRKRQQLAKKRSVSNAEIAFLAGLRLRKVGMKKLFITG